MLRYKYTFWYMYVSVGSVGIFMKFDGFTYRWIWHAASHLFWTSIGWTVASWKTTGRWHFHFIRCRIHRHCHAAADEILLQLERPWGVKCRWRVNFEALTLTTLRTVLQCRTPITKSTKKGLTLWQLSNIWMLPFFLSFDLSRTLLIDLIDWFLNFW